MSEVERREKHAGIWARDPNDWYIEDRWCSLRLFQEEQFVGAIFDPACGTGRIVESARACGLEASGSDKIQRDPSYWVLDFLSARFDRCIGDPANIVSNPPFAVADEFVVKALQVARNKVAMLLPATWHFGDKRARWLKTTPLRKILALTPRPSMPPGAVIMAGEKPGGGTKDFAFYIWQRGWDSSPETGWLHRDGEARG